MRIAVTGAGGFLGWHVRCAALAQGIETVPIDRSCLADAGRLSEALAKTDAVVHLAGVNRGDDRELRETNELLARQLVTGLSQVRAARRLVVVNGNSIQCGNGTAFGQGKELAADVLTEWAGRGGGTLVDVRLPNIFGEHGRPFYNSVFATFAHQVVSGAEPTVVEDRSLNLLAAQDAADVLVAGCLGGEGRTVEPSGREMTVLELLRTLESMWAQYRAGLFPSLGNDFDIAVFNALRSHVFGARPQLGSEVHVDQRGRLFECVKAPSGGSQVFVSDTYPGQTRGNHFHRRKVERFVVISGEAVIRLRKLFTDHVVELKVGGMEPALVDIPTLWTHSIQNCGQDQLVTLFWANEIFEAEAPDTFPSTVQAVGETL